MSLSDNMQKISSSAPILEKKQQNILIKVGECQIPHLKKRLMDWLNVA